jgi:hypothetical protein
VVSWMLSKGSQCRAPNSVSGAQPMKPLTHRYSQAAKSQHSSTGQTEEHSKVNLLGEAHVVPSCGYCCIGGTL